MGSPITTSKFNVDTIVHYCNMDGQRWPQEHGPHAPSWKRVPHLEGLGSYTERRQKKKQVVK